MVNLSHLQAKAFPLIALIAVAFKSAIRLGREVLAVARLDGESITHTLHSELFPLLALVTISDDGTVRLGRKPLAMEGLVGSGAVGVVVLLPAFPRVNLGANETRVSGFLGGEGVVVVAGADGNGAMQVTDFENVAPLGCHTASAVGAQGHAVASADDEATVSLIFHGEALPFLGFGAISDESSIGLGTEVLAVEREVGAGAVLVLNLVPGLPRVHFRADPCGIPVFLSSKSLYLFDVSIYKYKGDKERKIE